MKKVTVLKLLAVMLIAVTMFSFTACSGYASSYSASLLVTSSTPQMEYVKFQELKGTYVIQLRKADGDGEISYNATFESGSLKVYYDAGEGKTELFTIKAGEKLSGSAGKVKKGKIVYVIIETDGKCTGGEFTFRV